MKKTVKELKETFNAKISKLKEQIDIAEKQPLNSIDREETANTMAVILRVLLADREKSLCVRCNYDKVLLFPLVGADTMAALNILQDYRLVAFTINNLHASFSSVDLEDVSKIYPVWLSFDRWLEEIVIDFKQSGYEPIARKRIIKLISDKQGAHVDDDIIKFVELARSENICPVTVIGPEGQNCTYDCSNLLVETIISISKELVYSYELSRDFYPSILSESKWWLYTQVFDEGKKYIVCSENINAYNTNNYYNCSISKEKLTAYKIKFRNRFFPVEIIK